MSKSIVLTILYHIYEDQTQQQTMQ